MKNKILIGIVVVIIAGIFVGCGNESSNNPPEQESSKKEVKKEITFEEIGYNKDSDKNRSFIVYTDTEDNDELIKYARTKAWTERRLTYVTFVNSKDPSKVHENTLYQDFERGIMLEGIITDKDIVVGTFRKTPNGNEFWTEKGGFSVGTGEEVQLETK